MKHYTFVTGIRTAASLIALSLIAIIIIIIIKRKLKAQINRKNVTNAPR